jgi:hypothetical protein
MRNTWVALVCVALVGCGGDDGGGGSNSDAATGGGDAKQFLDAPISAPAQITISGQATAQDTSGSTALAGVTVAAFRTSDENTAIATTTTDAQGNYSLTLETGGVAIDGYLKATKGGYKETYLYPPYALAMDFDKASILMVNQGTWDSLSQIAQGNQQDGNGVIGLVVTDGANPVGGAVVSSTPAATPVRYNAPVGSLVIPSADATETYTEGVASIFNAAPGQLTVSAEKSGMTFSSHAVKAWADQLTTTVIVP